MIDAKRDELLIRVDERTRLMGDRLDRIQVSLALQDQCINDALEVRGWVRSIMVIGGIVTTAVIAWLIEIQARLPKM